MTATYVFRRTPAQAGVDRALLNDVSASLMTLQARMDVKLRYDLNAARAEETGGTQQVSLQITELGRRTAWHQDAANMFSLFGMMVSCLSPVRSASLQTEKAPCGAFSVL